VPPLEPKASALAPEPPLVREPHLSIPEDILWHYPLPERPGEWTRSYQSVQRRRGGRRLKLMLAWAGVFLVVLATGLAVLFGNSHELANRALPSAIDGPVGNVGASPAYDGPTAPPTASVAPVTTPAPLPSPPKDATEEATGALLAEAAAHLEEEGVVILSDDAGQVAAYRASLVTEEKLSRPASPAVESASASVSTPAAVESR
jgi:hypothetical protein